MCTPFGPSGLGNTALICPCKSCSIDLTTEEPACSSSSSAKSTNSSKSVEPKAEVKTSGSEEQDGGKLSLISWNVDGLDTVNLGERARGLCSYLAL